MAVGQTRRAHWLAPRVQEATKRAHRVAAWVQMRTSPLAGSSGTDEESLLPGGSGIEEESPPSGSSREGKERPVGSGTGEAGPTVSGKGQTSSWPRNSSCGRSPCCSTGPPTVKEKGSPPGPLLVRSFCQDREYERYANAD